MQTCELEMIQQREHTLYREKLSGIKFSHTFAIIELI